MKKKFYAIKKGLKIGIFTEWKECEKYIKGYSGATYKSFTTQAEAENYINNITQNITTENNNRLSAYVDGSFSVTKKIYSYGCVIILNDEKIYETMGVASIYPKMRNVAGEILGAQIAIEWAINQGFKDLTIFHDYEGIACWANGSWKANKDGTKAYASFIKSIKDKINLNFVKIAAHTGNKYNEEADRLAARAIEESVDKSL